MTTDDLKQLAAECEARASAGEKPVMEWRLSRNVFREDCFTSHGWHVFPRGKPLDGRTYAVAFVDGRHSRDPGIFEHEGMTVHAAQLFAEELLRRATAPLHKGMAYGDSCPSCHNKAVHWNRFNDVVQCHHCGHVVVDVAGLRRPSHSDIVAPYLEQAELGVFPSIYCLKEDNSFDAPPYGTIPDFALSWWFGLTDDHNDAVHICDGDLDYEKVAEVVEKFHPECEALKTTKEQGDGK